MYYHRNVLSHNTIGIKQYGIQPREPPGQKISMTIVQKYICGLLVVAVVYGRTLNLRKRSKCGFQMGDYSGF